MCPHAWPRAHKDPWLSPSILRKYARNFKTRTTPLDLVALDPQNTKISGPKTPPCAATLHQKVQKPLPQKTRATTRRHLLTRWHAPWRHRSLSGWPVCPADLVWSRPTWKSDPDPNRLQKKKKKVWEKMLWSSAPLTLTKKSKFSKGACPTQFFAYILILESVSLFETRKLCKLSNFQKVDFCTNIDQKSKFSRTHLAYFSM